MKIIKSPLLLHEFYVLNAKYKFNDPNDGEINIKKIFDQYELDFDFLNKTQETGEIFLYTKISINGIKNPLPGYVLFVESLSIFGFSEDTELTKKEKLDLLYISGLSIAINNLRTYISNMTSYYPFGKYLLPAIDLRALHNEKQKNVNKASKNKASK